MRLLFFLTGFLAVNAINAQNINFEAQRTTLYRYPLHPLDKSLKTYSVSMQEIGSFLEKPKRDTLMERALVLPGYERVKAGGDVQIELILNPLTVTSKELKDEPGSNEKDGVKTTFHQYWYAIGYNFPTRIRLLARGEVITEQDLPGFFTTEYYPRDRSSQASIQREYDNDYHFRNVLLGQRLEDRKKEIRDWLFSNYGEGFTQRLIDVGYVKDKKGEYPDITKALSLMMAAIKSTDKKKDYIDEEYKNKFNEAISLYRKELAEFSEDKKARVNGKVAPMLHYNIALAYHWMHELDAAEAELALVIEGVSGTQSRAYRLKEEVQDRRLRLVANGLMEGELPAPLPKPVLSPAPPEVEESKATYRDYIVFTNGDTLDVQFVMPSRDVMQYGDSVWLQDQVVVLEDGKTTEVLARDLSAYAYQGVPYETFSRVVDTSTTPFKIEYKMYKRIETGAISLYDCYKVGPSFRDPNQIIVTRALWYKKGDKFEIGAYGNFNKGVSKLVSDYPELSERVKNGEFMKDDLRKVIREYNEWKISQ